MSRAAFEAWASNRLMSVEIDTALEAWQAAERATAARCAEIAVFLGQRYRIKYKGMPNENGVRVGGSYDQYDDGMSEGAQAVEGAIRAEYPEAFK